MDRPFRLGLRHYQPQKKKKKDAEPHTCPFHSHSRVKETGEPSKQTQQPAVELPTTRRIRKSQQLPAIIQRQNNVAKLNRPPASGKLKRMRLLTETERTSMYEDLFWKINREPSDDITLRNRAYLRVKDIYQQEFKAAHIDLQKELQERITRRRAVLDKIEREKEKLLESLIAAEECEHSRLVMPASRLQA